MRVRARLNPERRPREFLPFCSTWSAMVLHPDSDRSGVSVVAPSDDIAPRAVETINAPSGFKACAARATRSICDYAHDVRRENGAHIYACAKWRQRFKRRKGVPMDPDPTHANDPSGDRTRPIQTREPYSWRFRWISATKPRIHPLYREAVTFRWEPWSSVAMTVIIAEVDSLDRRRSRQNGTRRRCRRRR